MDSTNDESNLSKSEEKNQPKQNQEQKIGGQLNDADKLQAIYDMLPMIREAYSICQFMLENRWFNTAYKWYMDKDSLRRKTEQLFAVLDYYGIAHTEEKNAELLSWVIYRKQEHIDIICKYLAIEWIAYDRDDFRYKPLPQDEKTVDWYKPTTNPQFSNWTP